MPATAKKATEADAMRAKGYVRIKDAAAAARRHYSAVYRGIESKDITAVRIGGLWYVKWDSVLRWFNGGNPEAARLAGLPADAAHVPPAPAEE